MESLDLTYKLIASKIESKTLGDQFYVLANELTAGKNRIS